MLVQSFQLCYIGLTRLPSKHDMQMVLQDQKQDNIDRVNLWILKKIVLQR
jgi:hypothetical protein